MELPPDWLRGWDGSAWSLMGTNLVRLTVEDSGGGDLVKHLLMWLLTMAVGLLFVFVGYWGLEYYLVWNYTRQTVAANEQILPSDVKVVQIQLLGSHPLTKPFRPHSWIIAYQDPRFRTLGLGDSHSGIGLHVVEPAFATFNSFTVHSSPQP